MANLPEQEFIWKNGEMVKWADATTHVLSHSLHYGSGVFEGLRMYKDPDCDRSMVFRLRDHMVRLHNSAKIAKMDLPFSVDELVDATLETCRVNGLSSAYIRPLVYRGYGTMGVDPTGSPTDVIIAAWPWEAYLGEEALAKGIKMGTSSWRQRSINAIPPAVKATASYFNSLLAKLEAKEHGYEEAVMLNEAGKVCEGTGENLFIVKNGVLKTPPTSDGLLEGITRDSIIQVAHDLDIPFEFASLVRSDLYTADEVFLSGSAAELTPVAEIDGIQIGEGSRGPVTEKLQKQFFEVLWGHVKAHADWNFDI